MLSTNKYIFMLLTAAYVTVSLVLFYAGIVEGEQRERERENADKLQIGSSPVTEGDDDKLCVQ